ncbi:anthranilate phosphoribosyltransferase [Thermovibrio ammonificans HB-1]|uniref:Anthranilate phosphoribosyltransferase n=1 Tax=Thermovibrio ammonificans (strain DSM 15698 / JCM 12110 / HB-1) TaxID=648996 RepID=E8T1V7_THEA1|nr:anthranilate phosphoribosyltransferase [Thermovibrio ammonificans]ADU96852.1 anthranilate phosphoribosyltransferase [Thermovibrio ammonificans HB-1]
MEVKETLESLINGRNLSEEEARELFYSIMESELTPAQTAAVLTALRCKGETVPEIAGAAKVMREKSLKVELPDEIRSRLVDTCGTGGDLKGTFNISTTVALVVASCGVPVAKHGNRSVSSKCGSADILESFGVKVDLKPHQVARCIEELNFGFMFAPVFHPAMAAVAPVRRELGIRTIFNLLGPLTNPAGAKRQLLGVFSEKLTEPIGEVLQRLGTTKAFVVHGKDGTDEITVCDETKITEVSPNGIKSYTVKPEDFGLRRYSHSEIKGGQTVEENREIVRRILTGEEKGAKRDVVALNTAFALLVAGAVERVEEGIEIAKEKMESGEPYRLLCRLVKLTNSFGD